MACDSQQHPTADCHPRTRDLAATEWVHAAEYCRKYDVPLQAIIRRTTLGARLEDATHRSTGKMRSAQSYDAVGDARVRARLLSLAGEIGHSWWPPELCN